MKTLQGKRVVTQFKVLGITVLKKERTIFFDSKDESDNVGASKIHQKIMEQKSH